MSSRRAVGCALAILAVLVGTPIGALVLAKKNRRFASWVGLGNQAYTYEIESAILALQEVDMAQTYFYVGRSPSGAPGPARERYGTLDELVAAGLVRPHRLAEAQEVGYVVTLVLGRDGGYVVFASPATGKGRFLARSAQGTFYDLDKPVALDPDTGAIASSAHRL